LWGATFVLVHDALADCSVFVFLAVRFTLAAILLAPVYWADLRRMTAAEFRAGLEIGIFMFGGYAFQTAGLAETTPSKAAFITGFSVVLVPVFMALFWRARIGGWAWAGVGASIAGLYYLTVPVAGFTDLNRGDLLVLVCAVLYAFQIIYIARYSPKYSMGALSFLQVAATAAFSLAALPLLAATRWESPRLHMTFSVVSAILFTAIFTTAIAYPLLVWAQRHASATHTALILSSEPVFAAVTSFIAIHERLGARALAGAGLILLGILLVELKSPAPEAGGGFRPLRPEK
jgi:drug/metabolite transporter (DMT)-like permease